MKILQGSIQSILFIQLQSELDKTIYCLNIAKNEKHKVQLGDNVGAGWGLGFGKNAFIES